ncbi:MAG: LptF/LptG family permease, partial [Planctomycetota bacterium]
QDRFLIRGDQPDLENERIVGVVVLHLPDESEIAGMVRLVRNLEASIADASDPVREAALRERAAALRARIEAERHDIQVFAASSAEVLGIRATTEGEILVSVAPTSPLYTDVDRLELRATDSAVFDLPPLENPGEEETTWFGWGRLIAILEEPSKHSEIQKQLETHRHEIGKSMLHRRVVETIGRDEPYQELRSADGRDTFRIWAPQAEWDRKEGSVELMDAVDANNRRRPVTVEVFRDGQRYRTVTATHGYVTADFSEMYGRTAVTILLAGSKDGGEPVWLYEHEIGGEPVNIDQWKRDGLPLPPPIEQAQDRIDLEDLCYNPESFTRDPDLLAEITRLRERDMPRLVLDVIAEMHKRIAYGASCFMMVAMGAALGLMFRGGQVVQAFALSVVPAALVIILVYMGGEMIRNVSVPTAVGVASLWSGIGLITLGNVMLYGRLARK